MIRHLLRLGTRTLAACGLACLLGATAVPTAARVQALPLVELIQGDWIGAGPPGKITIRVSGHTLHFFVRADFWYEATFTVSARGDLFELHATITDSSPPRKDLGEIVHAIVKVEDGTLSLAVDDGSEAAPDSFSTAMSRYDLRKAGPQDPGR